MKFLGMFAKGAVAALTLILLAGGAGAATLTVDDSGGADYTRIQDAIDNASAGDTILVCGTYYVNVNTQLILKGIDNGWGKPMVNAQRSGSAITLTANGITLEGFKTVNSGIPRAGINVSSSYNVIKNNTADINPCVGIYLDYDLKDNSGKENQTVIAIDERTIAEHTLKYTTSGEPKILNVVEKAFDGNFSAAKSAGLEEFDAGKMSPTAGAYISMDWLGEKYVGIKNKPNKLAKLVIEQGSELSENKTLMVGETWDIGGGWTLSAPSIDARSTPRRAWLVLSKDGIKKDDKVISEKKVYTYVENGIGGESNVPLFVTYIDSIFAGVSSDMVTLRYTWAIDTNITFIQLPPPSSLTILINNGKAYTNSPSIILSLSATNAEEMSFSNDGTAWSTWETFVLTKVWTLAAGDGTKTVYFKARSVSGESAPVSDTIILDTTPPASITNLHNISYAHNYMNWTWTDPSDADFLKVIIYLDGSFQINFSKGVQYYNATGLTAGSTHTIATRTVDSAGNINQTWVNHTATTNYSGETKGDVNRNVRRDTGDATLILRSIVGLPIPSQYMPILPIGDMNCNNRIDTGDATLVLRDVVSLPISKCWE